MAQSATKSGAPPSDLILQPKDFATFGHGEKSVLSFPAPWAQGEVVYAAFRVEPAPEEKQGVLIGLTRVGAGAF